MGTRLNRLAEAVLTSTHNLCFDQKYEKYQFFLSEKFHFLVVKFSIYLNRHVFVMTEAIAEISKLHKEFKIINYLYLLTSVMFVMRPSLDRTSRKHTYIILAPLNPTFI